MLRSVIRTCSLAVLALGMLIMPEGAFATTPVLPETTGLDVAGYSTALLGSIVTVIIAAIGAGFALFAVRRGVVWVRSMVK